MSEQLSQGTTVRFCGSTCRLYQTTENIIVEPVTETTRCCCFSVGRFRLSLSRDEVIGAERICHSTFVLHYAKETDPGEKRFRLLTTSVIDVGKGMAHLMVEYARQWARNEPNRSEQKILFIVNPKSGTGKGERIYSRKIKPLLRDALGWVIVDRVTQKPGDATHIMQTANIQSFTAVGIIGGDGTVHEVLQGLLNRPDWNECVRTPLIPIPVGSGNALAKSLGICDIQTAIYSIAKGRIRDMDVLCLHQDNCRIFSFLGIMYGALSKLDIETEKYRWMGDFRFTIGAIRELVRMNSYGLDFAYLPYDEAQDVAPVPEIQPSTSYPSRADWPKSENTENIPQTIDQDELEGVRKWLQNPDIDSCPSKWVAFRNYQTRLMALLKLPYISATSHFMPGAEIDDGAFHLLLTPTEEADRAQMLKLFLKSEQGQHLGLPGVYYKKIKAFLFLPSDNSCVVTVDGETCPTGLIAVELIPRLIKVLSTH